MKVVSHVWMLVLVILIGTIKSAPRATTTDQIVLPDENFSEVNIEGTLTAGNINVAHGIKIFGSVKIEDGLTVAGDSVFENISVTNNANINHLSVYGDATLCDNVTICNNLDVGGTLTVPNLNTNLNFTDLTVVGNGTIDGTLSVGGLATFANGIDITNNTSLTISGTGGLSVGGQTNLSTLSTSGNATVNGNLTINGSLSLPGSFTPNNIDLPDSTSTTGKITKAGGVSFIINPGGSNTFVGKNAGTFALTSGVNNSGFGVNTLISINTTAQNNTAVGPNALENITTGSFNIGIGSNAGNNYINTESSNIVIGNSGIIGDNNTIRIGTDGTGSGQQNRCFITGIYGKIVGASSTVLVNANGQLGTVVSSKRFKENITPISDDLAAKLFQATAIIFNYKDDVKKQPQYGFIAEEIETLIRDLVIYDEDGMPFTIQYHFLYALLHKMITVTKERIDLMEEKILALEQQFKSLNSR